MKQWFFYLGLVCFIIASILFNAALNEVLSTSQLHMFNSGLTIFGIALILLVEYIKS